jgi:hypothetical protein
VWQSFSHSSQRKQKNNVICFLHRKEHIFLFRQDGAPGITNIVNVQSFSWSLDMERPTNFKVTFFLCNYESEMHDHTKDLKDVWQKN